MVYSFNLFDWSIFHVLINQIAVNPHLEKVHEAASKRLEELKLSKQTMVDLNKAKKKKTKRDKVEIIMEEDDESNKQELVAEEN